MRPPKNAALRKRRLPVSSGYVISRPVDPSFAVEYCVDLYSSHIRSLGSIVKSSFPYLTNRPRVNVVKAHRVALRFPPGGALGEKNSFSEGPRWRSCAATSSCRPRGLTGKGGRSRCRRSSNAIRGPSRTVSIALGDALQRPVSIASAMCCIDRPRSASRWPFVDRPRSPSR